MMYGPSEILFAYGIHFFLLDCEFEDDHYDCEATVDDVPNIAGNR